MTDNPTATQQAPQRSNRTLWILILVFVVPIVGAYAYFFLVDDYEMGNHGDLIQPVVQIETLHISDENGEPQSRDELIHIWKMMLVTDGDCSGDCKQALYYMRQINTALGKNSNRFKHMLIHTAPMSDELRTLVETEYPDTLHGYASMTTLSEAFPEMTSPEGANAIYIMDPLGNVMMRFPVGIPPKMILKDLNRLLKISRIG